jgi:hypothetical protein
LEAEDGNGCGEREMRSSSHWGVTAILSAVKHNRNTALWTENDGSSLHIVMRTGKERNGEGRLGGKYKRKAERKKNKKGAYTELFNGSYVFGISQVFKELPIFSRVK